MEKKASLPTKHAMIRMICMELYGLSDECEIDENAHIQEHASKMQRKTKESLCGQFEMALAIQARRHTPEFEVQCLSGNCGWIGMANERISKPAGSGSENCPQCGGATFDFDCRKEVV